MKKNIGLPRWSGIALSSVLLGVVLGTAGCADMMVGHVTAPGIAVYSLGDLGTVENTSMESTWTAVQAAIKKLELTEFKSSKDGLEARIEAHSSQDRTVVVIVRRINATSTELHIRIGTFGDEAYSRQVLEAIHGALGVTGH